MNRRYDNYLVRKYEPLYCDRFGDVRSTAMCWGFEVGDGWFNIIDTLSRELCSEWLYAKKQYDTVKDRIGELKYPEEKPQVQFNVPITQEMIDSAREYMEQEAEKVPTVTQVKEKFGGLRFYVSTATDEQYGMIRLAEALSYNTCEICGSRGRLGGNGWFSTRCAKHRNTFEY